MKDLKTGISIYFEGKISRKPTKLGVVETETNLGARKSEHTRAVIDLEIRVDYMSEENYDNLEKLFMVSNNKINLEDIDRGKYYSGYFIYGDSLEFSEQEDIENNAYYYTGGLQLKKR